MRVRPELEILRGQRRRSPSSPFAASRLLVRGMLSPTWIVLPAHVSSPWSILRTQKKPTPRSTALLRLTRLPGADPVTDLEPYRTDVDRALSGKFRSLYFSARLERLFEHETQQARSGHLVAVGTLWIVVGFAAAILFERSGASASFGMNVGVRAGVVTPILAAIVFAVWWACGQCCASSS